MLDFVLWDEKNDNEGNDKGSIIEKKQNVREVQN